MQAAAIRALIGLALLAESSAAADLRADASSECQSRKPSHDQRWWSFRLGVGGIHSKCWYPGKPGKPISELHWTRRSGVERPGAAVSNPPDDPGALSCCWPAPVEPERPVEPTFKQRWNDMLNDMAEPVTRWRGQLKDQHRFGE